jgi:cytochrome c553
MKLKAFPGILVPLSLAFSAGFVAAADEAGDDEGMGFEAKLQSCFACHGENGDKPLLPDYPIIAGQYADYLAQALRSYRNGRRQHPIMTAQVTALGLTDADIEGLAEYFSEKKGLTNLGK